MSSPSVSVIIPVFNGAEFLAEAVESVRAQNYSPIEIVVVDDGSTDDTAQVVQSLGADILYAYQPNHGPAAARNFGLSLAHGDLISFLDADDLWPTDKLHHQVSSLITNTETEVVWGSTQVRAYRADETLYPPLPPKWWPLLGSMTCRKEVFEAVGGFDPALHFGEDIDWLTRLNINKVRVQRLPELALIYRVRPGSLTYDKTLKELGLFDNIRRSLKRHREAEHGS